MENTTSGSRPESSGAPVPAAPAAPSAPESAAAAASQSSIPPTADEARAALDAVASSRAKVAAQMRRAPRWYHVAYGLGCALLVTSVGIQQRAVQLTGLGLAVLVFGGLIGVYRVATGIALAAAPRPWRAMVAFTVVLAVAVVASWLDGLHGVGWGVAVLAVVTGVAGWALSGRYERDQLALLEERGA